METTKQRKQITDKYSSIPEGQVEPGVYLDKVGYKYVYLLDTHDGVSIRKIDIDDFCEEYL